MANENTVHSLEHGAVWLTYRPDLPAAQVAARREQLSSTYAVLSPFPGLKAPVVASAWGKQLVLTGADDPRLGAFVKAYRQGPQTRSLVPPAPVAPATRRRRRAEHDQTHLREPASGRHLEAAPG